MPEIMRLAFKYKLRPNRKQEQAMRNFSGCCRFAYNALLAQEKEEYQEYLEELEFKEIKRRISFFKRILSQSSPAAESHGLI